MLSSITKVPGSVAGMLSILENRKDSYSPKNRPLQLIVFYILPENHIPRLPDKSYLNLAFTQELRCNFEYKIMEYKANSVAIKTNKKY